MTAPSRKGFTKAGQPRMGAELTFRLADGTTEQGKVVAKFFGRGGSADLVRIAVEWSDGTRQPLPWPDILTALADDPA